jgi:ADP-ribosylglycohydrolase
MERPSREHRIAGCLLAGALGDAIGSHFEGQRPNADFVVPSELRITDDTQLTIATCESIIELNRVDPKSIASHVLRWFRERRLTGIGSSTLKALRDLPNPRRCFRVRGFAGGHGRPN